MTLPGYAAGRFDTHYTAPSPRLRQEGFSASSAPRWLFRLAGDSGDTLRFGGHDSGDTL